jgi:hypothetical protein
MMQQPAGGMDMQVQMDRMRRLATMDTDVFAEVRSDQSATIPAIAVAVISTLLFALGGWLWWIFQGGPDTGDLLLKSVIMGSILSIVLWALALGLTYVLLTQVFRARADINELVRVMGFGAAPLALGVLMFIPQFEMAIGVTSMALFFGLTMIAIQSATDAPAGRVLVSWGAGFLVWAAILALFVGRENAYAPGFFIFDFGIEYLRRIVN